MSSTSLKTHIHVLQSALSVMKLIKKKKKSAEVKARGGDLEPSL